MIIRVKFSSNNLVVSEVSLWDFSSEKESVMRAYSSEHNLSIFCFCYLNEDVQWKRGGGGYFQHVEHSYWFVVWNKGSNWFFVI
jgi:hypothetical protein